MYIYMYLCFLVGVVGDVDKLVGGRRGPLLVLGGDEHADDSDQLELGPLDGQLGEKGVEVVHGEVESLVRQSVL